jgi:heme oxygenase
MPSEASAPSPLSEALRRETSPWHDRLETLPFPRDLAEGRATRDAYTAYLLALSHVHAALDEVSPSSPHPSVRTTHSAASPGRLNLLRLDLAALAPHPPAGPSTAQALLLGEEIRRLALDEPASLIGFLYVLEGSSLGGLLLADLASRALGLADGLGVSYLRGAGRETMRHWTRFKAHLDALPLDDDSRLQAIDGAIAAFAGLHRVLESLSARTTDQPLRDQVCALNPIAGMHAIASDPREIEAALRAGEHTWREFPYYAMRYGDRGRRFTRSDSAWLAGLCALPPDLVLEQVDWLSRVLAARGMPRLLMERHLRVLHAHLALAVPDRRPSYRSLLLASRRLRDLRRSVLPEPSFRSLSSSFPHPSELPLVGPLLASAACDEASGLPGALSSLEPWLTDPSRFSPPFISSVRETLSRARTLVCHS